MRRLPAIALAALLLACGGPDLEQKVPTASGGQLEVDLYMGEGLRPDPGWLEVRSHDATDVRVAASASGWGASGVSYRLEHEKGVVRLYGRVTGALSWLFGGPQMAVRIWVPRDYSVDLRTSAGPIHVDEVNGRIRVRGDDGIEVTASGGKLRARGAGDVRVSEMDGDVDVRVSSGEIDLSWIRGDVEAHTGRGGIRTAHTSGGLDLATGRGAIELREVEGRARARTERGSVYASFSGAPEGGLETSRGDVRVQLADGTGAELEARARRGEVEIAGLSLRGERDASHARGRLGPGGPTLRLFTARGDVRVGRR